MKRILFFILLVISFAADAQVKQQMGTYGIRSRRIQPDSALRIPTVQVGIKDAYAGFDTAQIYYRKSDSSLLTYTGSQWILARGAGGTTYTAGDGLNLTGSDFKVLTKRSITIDNDSLMLVNDSTASPALYSYRINAAGRKGWYPDNTLIGVNLYNSNGTLTGDRAVKFNGKDLTFYNSNGGAYDSGYVLMYDQFSGGISIDHNTGVTSTGYGGYYKFRPNMFDMQMINNDSSSRSRVVGVPGYVGMDFQNATGASDLTMSGDYAEISHSKRFAVFENNGGSLGSAFINIDFATDNLTIGKSSISNINIYDDSITVLPGGGNLFARGLDAGASTDSVLVMTASTGQVKYRNASAFGGTYTFTNGLTESGGTVKLGGTLVDAGTTIDADNKELTISDIGLFQILGTGAEVKLSVSGAVTEINGGTPTLLSTITVDDTIKLTNNTKSNLSIGNRVAINPYQNALYIDSLAYTLSTTGKKIMLRDTATGLVQNIDPALITGATPTLQQVLTAGSTLTTANTIDLAGNELEITDNGYDIFMLAPADSNDPTWLESTFTMAGRAQMGTFKTQSGPTSSFTQMTSHYDILDSNIHSQIDLRSNKDSSRILYEADDGYHRFSGNVGIGTVPTSLLHVAGTTKLVDGTEGQGKVLTSDASGNATWKYDTTTLATFTAGANFAADTAAFTDSTIYGSFKLMGNDTFYVTGVSVVLYSNNAITDTLGIQITYNDTINVIGSHVFVATYGVNNGTTGQDADADDFTGSNSVPIPPGNWVWLKSPTVVAGRKPYHLSVSIIGYKKRVN